MDAIGPIRLPCLSRLVALVCAVLLAGSCSTPQESAGNDGVVLAGRTAEEALIETPQVIRIDAGEDWYWLVSADYGLLEAVGRSEHELDLIDGEPVPTRLMGIEGDGAIVAYDEEPQGLDWLDGRASLKMVEFPLMSLEDRYLRAGWSNPMVTGRMTGDDASLILSQSAMVGIRWLSALHYARRYCGDGGTKVAWWGMSTEEKTGDSRVDRLRYFDPQSPEWERITRTLNEHGLGNIDFSDEDGDRAGHILAGEFGFALG